MPEIDETRFSSLETTVREIQEYIRRGEETKEQQWKTKLNGKLENIEDMVKTISERQVRTSWQWPMAFGVTGLAIGYNFWVIGADRVAALIIMILGLLLVVAAPFTVKKSK